MKQLYVITTVIFLLLWVSGCRDEPGDLVSTSTPSPGAVISKPPEIGVTRELRPTPTPNVTLAPTSTPMPPTMTPTQWSYPAPGQPTATPALWQEYPAPTLAPTRHLDSEPGEAVSSVYFPLVRSNYKAAKAGFAWAEYGTRQPHDAEYLGATWFLVWSPIDPHQGRQRTGIESVTYAPCPTGGYQAYGDAVKWDAFDRLDKYLGRNWSGPILFLNEPDLPDQCNLNPIRAAKFYAQLRKQYAKAILIGPAVSDGDYVKGWPWMKGFYDELERMKVKMPDHSAIHSYVRWQHPQVLVDSHFDMLAQYSGAPTTAWVTEFAACGRPDRLAQMIDTYQNDERILRYAYFGPRIFDVPDWYCMSLFVSPTTYELTDAGVVWTSRH